MQKLSYRIKYIFDITEQKTKKEFENKRVVHNTCYYLIQSLGENIFEIGKIFQLAHLR